MSLNRSRRKLLERLNPFVLPYRCEECGRRMLKLRLSRPQTSPSSTASVFPWKSRRQAP